MSGKRPKPPEEGAWTRAIAEVNAEAEARAEAAGVEPVRGGDVAHPGRRRPDLWETFWDVLDMLDGDAAKRLEAALSDPMASEALVEALETWEIREGDPVATYRQRHGDADRRTAKTRLKDIGKRLDHLDIEDMIPRLVAAALAVEGRPGAPQGAHVGRAARKAARALADLRALVVQAEAAAPKARGGQPQAETQARERLFDDVRRALGCKDDAVFNVICQALWEALTGAEELPDYQRNDR